MSECIRIVIVDSFTLTRAGMRVLLERVPQFQIVGEAGEVQEAQDVIAREQPDMVLFISDAELDVIKHLVNAASCVRLVLVTSSSDSRFHQRAVELGAMGIVHKSQTAEALIKAITKVNSGEAWLDRATVANMLEKMSQRRGSRQSDPEVAKIATLSPRECEIIALAGQGLRNNEIGDRLSISEVTVRHYFTTIFTKLNVCNRLELIIFAYRHQLAQPPR